MSAPYNSQDAPCDCYPLTDGVIGTCLIYSGDLFVSQPSFHIQRITSQSLYQETACTEGWNLFNTSHFICMEPFHTVFCIFGQVKVMGGKKHLVILFCQYVSAEIYFVSCAFANVNNKMARQNLFNIASVEIHLIFAGTWEAHYKLQHTSNNPTSLPCWQGMIDF